MLQYDGPDLNQYCLKHLLLTILMATKNSCPLTVPGSIESHRLNIELHYGSNYLSIFIEDSRQLQCSVYQHCSRNRRRNMYYSLGTLVSPRHHSYQYVYDNHSATVPPAVQVSDTSAICNVKSMCNPEYQRYYSHEHGCLYKWQVYKSIDS